MYRTSAEEAEYSRLKPEYKKRYDFESDLHPEWEHSDVVNKIMVSVQLDNHLKYGGRNAQLSTEDIRKIIFEAQEEIKTTCPSTWNKVKDAFFEVLNALDELIARGIEWIGEKIDNAIDWVDENIVTPVFDFLDDIFG